jgi:hypothetical protein
MWAADQVSSLTASTINSMDSGFVGPADEAAAADGHASLLVSGVLYRQWLAGELGSSTTPTAQRFGPALLQAQALNWQQAAGSPAQVAAADAAKESAFKNTAAQVQATDPPAYPVLQGTEGSRVGIGVFTLADAIAVCGFDVFASLMIILGMLFTLVVIIFLPGFAVVGLHHGLRQAVTGTLSRAAGRLYKAVLYAAAGGVNVRASQFLLTKENALAPGATLSSIAFLILIIHIALGIALILAVRKISTGRAIPRAVMFGGLLAADVALRRGMAGRTAPAAAAAGADGAAAGMVWTATAETRLVPLSAGAGRAGPGGSGPPPPPSGNGSGTWAPGRRPPSRPAGPQEGDHHGSPPPPEPRRDDGSYEITSASPGRIYRGDSRFGDDTGDGS